MIIITFFVLYCNPFSCIKYNFFAFDRFFFFANFTSRSFVLFYFPSFPPQKCHILSLDR